MDEPRQSSNFQTLNKSNKTIKLKVGRISLKKKEILNLFEIFLSLLYSEWSNILPVPTDLLRQYYSNFWCLELKCCIRGFWSYITKTLAVKVI